VTAAVVIVFFALALAAVPLAFALGIAAFAGITAGDVEWHVLPQRMMHAVNSFPLLAIPCFMLAGSWKSSSRSRTAWSAGCAAGSAT
jgi:C4-dicarboxylate transporter DctM subunit